jgi:hypothetical protein
MDTTQVPDEVFHLPITIRVGVDNDGNGYILIHQGENTKIVLQFPSTDIAFAVQKKLHAILLEHYTYTPPGGIQ